MDKADNDVIKIHKLMAGYVIIILHGIIRKSKYRF